MGGHQHMQDITYQTKKRRRSESPAQSRHDARVAAAVAAAAITLLPPAVIVGASGQLVCDSGGWDLTPSDAYVWSYAPPQGCTCQETGVPLAECKIFDCGCVCDLTAGQCDTNCCCDAECSQSELERFIELSACLHEGPADEVVTTCYSTDYLDNINPRYPLTGGGAAQGAVDGLLCVQYDNSASKGEFYEDPGTLPTSIFGDSGASEFSYHDNLVASAASATTETDAYFDKGDRIPAAYEDDDGGTTAAFGGFFPLPVADDSGRCNEANFVGFEVPVPAKLGEENACAREVVDLESQCSSVFNWERFSTQLFAGTDGTVAPSSVFLVGEYTPVEISSTTWRDWDTGRETDFAEVNCGAFYFDGTAVGSTNSACLLGGGSGETTASAANATEGCKNALASICYTIIHDGEGSVTAVTAAIVLTDIPPGPSAGDSSAVSPQQFSVEFRLDETSDAFSEMTQSQDLGNLVKRERSGNPGYLPGLAVLAGRLESSGDDEYIAAGGSAGAGGLELMAGEGRGCDDVGTTPVEFAYDGFGCCVLALTREALGEHCTGSGQHVDPNTGFTPLAFLNTSSSVGYLGSYGNADPLDVSQWVELSFSSSADTASWDDDSGVCSSMVSTLEYRILYAPVGSKANPQNKIVSAAARYGKSDWVWREESGSEQNFLVCNSVSFKLYEQETQQYTPPSPPVAFTVPWDVFYPFYISTSGCSARASSPSRNAYVVAVAVVALAVGPSLRLPARLVLF